MEYDNLLELNGLQAQIHEFSSGGGGFQPSEKFWQAKNEKGGGFQKKIYSA